MDDKDYKEILAELNKDPAAKKIAQEFSERIDRGDGIIGEALAEAVDKLISVEKEKKGGLGK